MALLLQSACWDGTMGDGALKRRVVLEERDSSRVLVTLFARQPQLVVMQRRGAGMDALSAVSVNDGGAMRMALSPVRTVPGRDDDDLPPLERSGWLFTGRDSLRLVLRPARPVDEQHWSIGEWNGVLSNDGVPVRLGVRLMRGPCGVLTGTLDSPDQSPRNLPLTSGVGTFNTARIDLSYLGLAITLSRPVGAAPASALFAQDDRFDTITLKRGDVQFAARRPQEPVAPLPYDTIAVTIGDSTRGARLAGTLTMPTGTGPFPAIVLIGGSGAKDRNASVAGHRPFLVLADKLTRAGWAVLRLDDRGVGGSSGNVLQATLGDLANDVLMAATWLRGWPDVDSTRVALLSHGEGGYLAPMVATRASWIRALVMLAPPAVSGRVLLAQQRAASARVEGANPAQAAADSALTRAIGDAIAARQSAIPIDSAVARAIRTVRRSVSVVVRRSIDELLAERTPAQDSSAFAFWSTPWFTSFVRYEPDSTLRAIQVPVLAIFGQLDVQVPAVANSTMLHDALEDVTNEEAQRGSLVAILPGINHLMQTSVMGSMGEYAAIDETIATVVIDAILKFLSGRR